MEAQFVDDCARMLEQQSQALWAGLAEPDSQLPLVRELMRCILECEPEQIVAALEAHASAPRALLSWLLHEGGRLSGVSPEKVERVRGAWDRGRRVGQRIITVPRPAAALA